MAVQVPKLLVTVAPLTPRLVSNMDGLENIRPDEDVGMVSSISTQNRLQVYSLALILPVSLLIFCWMPWDKFFNHIVVQGNYIKSFGKFITSTMSTMTSS